MGLQELKLNLNSNLNCKLIKQKKYKNSNCSGPVSLKETGPTIEISEAHKSVQPRSKRPNQRPMWPVRPATTRVQARGYKRGA
jgi:hypothetical protein